MKNCGFGLLSFCFILLAACQAVAGFPSPAQTKDAQDMVTPPLFNDFTETAITPTHIVQSTPTPYTTRAGPTARLTSTSFFASTPTISTSLLHSLPQVLQNFPEGLKFEVYRMAHGPFLDEGYEPIIRSLGDKSLLRSFPQGRYYWDTGDLARLARNNAALAPFGYKLVSKPVSQGTGARWYTLFQEDRVLLDPVLSMGFISVNRSKNDFILLVSGMDAYFLLRRDGLETWYDMNATIDLSTPQFFEDDIMLVEVDQSFSASPVGTPEPANTDIRVMKNDMVIFSKSRQSSPISSGFYGLWTYTGHWAIETTDEVVIDGKEVNAIFGYEKSFSFHLLDDKPLFFFEKMGKLGLFFDGETAILPFDTIPHYGCCSAGLLNPGQIENVLFFYARQNGIWHYVEMASR